MDYLLNKERLKELGSFSPEVIMASWRSNSNLAGSLGDYTENEVGFFSEVHSEGTRATGMSTRKGNFD